MAGLDVEVGRGGAGGAEEGAEGGGEGHFWLLVWLWSCLGLGLCFGAFGIGQLFFLRLYVPDIVIPTSPMVRRSINALHEFRMA